MPSIIVENREVGQHTEKLGLHSWHLVLFQLLQMSAWHPFTTVVECQSARSCVISAIPVQISWMLYSLLKWHWAPVPWTGILAFALWSSTFLKVHNSMVMVTAKHDTVGKLNKSLNMYVCAIIAFSLGLLRQAVGWALQLPALAETESLVGCCISQSRWELSGSESEIMERDAMCNSSLWAG